MLQNDHRSIFSHFFLFPSSHFSPPQDPALPSSKKTTIKKICGERKERDEYEFEGMSIVVHEELFTFPHKFLWENQTYSISFVEDVVPEGFFFFLNFLNH